MYFVFLRVKENIFVVLLTILSFQILSQPNIEWKSTIGGASFDRPNAIKEVSDGGYIVVGSTLILDGDTSSGHPGYHGNSDWCVAKFDNSGSVEWTKCIGGSISEEAMSIDETSDGAIVIAGYSNSIDGDIVDSINNGEDMLIIKLDFQGNILWQKRYDGGAHDRAHFIQKTSDSGFIVAGSKQNALFNFNGNDFWILKLDIDGDIIWQKTFGGTDEDLAYQIKQTSDGGYIVGGSTMSSDGDVTGINLDNQRDTWVIKIDSIGDIQWQRRFEEISTQYLISIMQSIDGGYILNNENSGTYGPTMIKLDEFGSTEWQNNYKASNEICEFQSGEFLILGGCYASPSFNYYLAKISNLGVVQWEECFGDSLDNNDAQSMDLTTDGGIILAGITSPISMVNWDFEIIKLNIQTSSIFNHLPSNKELINIYDIMGRDTAPVLNKILFYQYSDGSIEKKIIIE